MCMLKIVVNQESIVWMDILCPRILVSLLMYRCEYDVVCFFSALVSLQENTAVTDNDLRHGTRLSQFQPFKSLHDANFANYENLVLTKLIVSVMDNRRFVTNVHKVKKTLKIPQLESKDTPNYLSDEDFMTNICYDTMLDQFQKTLCFHLGN